MPIKIGDTNYTTFEDLLNESILTPEEKAGIQVKVDLAGKLIEVREQFFSDAK